MRKYMANTFILYDSMNVIEERQLTYQNETNEKLEKVFNQQYPNLKLRYTGVFHDRFLIIDKEKTYHIGASLKDAGKKCFAVSLLNDKGVVNDILQRLDVETMDNNIL